MKSCYSKDLEIEFEGCFSPESIFKLLKLDTSLSWLEYPFKQAKLLQVKQYKVRLCLSQVMPNYLAYEFVSLSFDIDSHDLSSLLPSSLTPFGNPTVSTVIYNPFTVRSVVDIKADFVVVVQLETRETISLDGSISARNEETCDATLRPLYRPFGAKEYIKGTAILNVLEYICGNVGCHLAKEVFHSVPILSVLSSLSLKTLQIFFIKKVVEGVQLKVFIPKWSISPYLTLCNASLHISHTSFSDTKLECHGKLLFEFHSQGKLHQYKFDAKFVPLERPLKNIKAFIQFDNCNDDVTLERALEGFGWLEKVPKQQPILSLALDQMVRNFLLEFNSSSQINAVNMSVYLEELHFGFLTFYHADLCVLIKTEITNWETCIKINALLGDVLFAELEYDSHTSILHGLTTVCDFSMHLKP